MNYKRSQDTFINKPLAVQIVFVAIAVSAILFFGKFFKIDSSPIYKGRGAALLIDFDNMKRMFEGEVTEKMTVLDALNASVTAGQIKLRYVVDANNNTTVFEINDHIAIGDKNFSFYVNEEKVDTKDLNRTFINRENKITIKLE